MIKSGEDVGNQAAGWNGSSEGTVDSKVRGCDAAFQSDQWCMRWQVRRSIRAVARGVRSGREYAWTGQYGRQRKQC